MFAARGRFCLGQHREPRAAGPRLGQPRTASDSLGERRASTRGGQCGCDEGGWSGRRGRPGRPDTRAWRGVPPPGSATAPEAFPGLLPPPTPEEAPCRATASPTRHAATGEPRVEGWGGFCRLPGPASRHKGRRGRPGCGGRRRSRSSREVKGSLPGLGLGLPSTAVAARACGRRHRRSGARRGLGRPKAEASPPPGCPPPRETREAEAAPPGPGRGEEAPRAPWG